MIERIDLDKELVDERRFDTHVILKLAIKSLESKLNEVIDAVNKLEPRCISHHDDGLTEHDKELSRAMGNHHD